MNKSIWEDYLNKKEFPKLNENIETDILVIGGGISGILNARKLQDSGYNVILVEKNKIGTGTTSKTTAFLTAQHETLYQDMALDKAKEYLELNNKAFLEYVELSKKYYFDFEYTNSCLFSKAFDTIYKEYSILKKIGHDVEILDDIPLFPLHKGIVFKNQAIINPIKLINVLSKDLKIYEHTEVVNLESNYAILKNGKIIKFKNAIITTHYPINNKLNLLFMKLTQRKSYVVAVKSKNISGTYCNIDNNGMYFRMYKDYLIIGGNDRDTGCICKNEFKNKVIELLNIKLDDIEYSWTGQDCITLDGVPYIGYSNVFHKNHIIVTGFNLWGFTWAMASTNIVLKILKENNICKLTKLQRIKVNKNLLKNI